MSIPLRGKAMPAESAQRHASLFSLPVTGRQENTLEKEKPGTTMTTGGQE